jgi:hypothetical protein
VGCESGTLYRIQRNLPLKRDGYEFCKELSYKTEGIYNNAWKNR